MFFFFKQKTAYEMRISDWSSDVCSSDLRRLSGLGKRLFDIAVSAAILLLTLPIVLLTALAVKLESEGPAFFRQRRIGLYGQGFEILKLRSMRQDAEVGGVAVWAEEDDPRVTRVGQVIRTLRIDELPQD